MDSDVMMATYEFLLDKGNIIKHFPVWFKNRLSMIKKNHVQHRIVDSFPRTLKKQFT